MKRAKLAWHCRSMNEIRTRGSETVYFSQTRDHEGYLLFILQWVLAQ